MDKKAFRLKNLPFCVKCGIIAFPSLMLSGVLLQIFTAGRANPFFWAIIPAVIFEQALERTAPAIADSVPANVAFLVAFWFFLGAFAGSCARKASSAIRRLNRKRNA